MTAKNFLQNEQIKFEFQKFLIENVFFANLGTSLLDSNLLAIIMT